MFGIGRFGHKEFPPSLEYPVQKPSSRFRDTEDPIPVASGIQTIEVVAGLQLPVPPLAGDWLPPPPVPPLAGDSRRPRDMIEPMNFAIVSERYRFAIAALRGSNDSLDRTGL